MKKLNQIPWGCIIVICVVATIIIVPFFLKDQNKKEDEPNDMQKEITQKVVDEKILIPDEEVIYYVKENGEYVEIDLETIIEDNWDEIMEHIADSYYEDDYEREEDWDNYVR